MEETAATTASTATTVSSGVMSTNTSTSMKRITTRTRIRNGKRIAQQRHHHQQIPLTTTKTTIVLFLLVALIGNVIIMPTTKTTATTTAILAMVSAAQIPSTSTTFTTTTTSSSSSASSSTNLVLHHHHRRNQQQQQQPNEKKNHWRFALVAKWATHPFFLAAEEGCNVGALEIMKEINSKNNNENDDDVTTAECIFVGPVDAPDGYEQQRIVQQLVQNRTVDAIAISVGLPDIIRPTIDDAVSLGIPVVTFDSDDPLSQRSAYIGTDNTFFGIQLGKTLEQLHPDGGTFGVIGSFHDAPNLYERMVGLRRELLGSNAPKIPPPTTKPTTTIEEESDPFWDVDEAPQLQTQRSSSSSSSQTKWTEVNGSPFAYNATDINSAFRQMEYFASQNVTAIVPVQVGPMAHPHQWKTFRNTYPHITLVNADDLDFQLVLLSHRYVDGLVGQLPFEMALLSMKALYKLVHNETLESDTIGTNLLVHLKVPLILPELTVDDSRIGNLRFMGYVFFGVTALAVVLACAWTYMHRHVRVVHASQPVFLYMVAIGVLVLGCTIIPLSFDDGGHEYDDRGNLDLTLTANDDDESRRVAMCMSIPWLAIMGFALVFASLFSKTWRINKIFLSKSFRRVQITVRQALIPCLLVLGLNLIVLVCWTIIDPLTYTRKPHEGTDGWNRELSTYGSCQSNNVTPYIVPLFVINIILLVVANWQAYQARFIESEFAESKYIAVCMASFLQAVVMGVPILALVSDNPEAFYLILVITIFLVCMVTLGVIFIPKVIYAREFEKMSKQHQDARMKTAIRRSSLTGGGGFGNRTCSNLFATDRKDSQQSFTAAGESQSMSSLRSRRRSNVNSYNNNNIHNTTNTTTTPLPVIRSSDDRPPNNDESEKSAADISGALTRRMMMCDPAKQEQVDSLPLAATSFAEGAASSEFLLVTSKNDDGGGGERDGNDDDGGLRLFRRREPLVLSVDDLDSDDGDDNDDDKNDTDAERSNDIEGGYRQQSLVATTITNAAAATALVGSAELTTTTVTNLDPITETSGTTSSGSSNALATTTDSTTSRTSTSSEAELAG